MQICECVFMKNNKIQAFYCFMTPNHKHMLIYMNTQEYISMRERHTLTDKYMFLCQ